MHDAEKPGPDHRDELPHLSLHNDGHIALSKNCTGGICTGTPRKYSTTLSKNGTCGISMIPALSFKELGPADNQKEHVKCEIRLADATGEENTARGRHNRQTSHRTSADEERGHSRWYPRSGEGCQAPHPATPHPGGRGGRSNLLSRVRLSQQ